MTVTSPTVVQTATGRWAVVTNGAAWRWLDRHEHRLAALAPESVPRPAAPAGDPFTCLRWTIGSKAARDRRIAELAAQFQPDDIEDL